MSSVFRSILLTVAALALMPACGSSGGPSREDQVSTRVQEVLAVTREAESSLQTAVAEVLTATAAVAPALNATPTMEPSATRSPTTASEPTATLDPPTPTPTVEPTATQEPIPTTTSPVDDYVQQGYRPFNWPEIDLMIHPSLAHDDQDSFTDEETALYRFFDPNADYLVFDIWVFKGMSPGGRVSHSFAQSVLSMIVEQTESLDNLEFVATDDTSIRDRQGVIVRHAFTTYGEAGYGVFMILNFGEWVYAFDVYGRDYEYEMIEELLHAIFETAYLRGPQEQATGPSVHDVHGFVA